MQAYLDGQVFGYMLVVARLGSALMFLPAFGEATVPMRARLSFALVLCLALYPATPVPPIQPGPLGPMALLFAAEVTVGLWIGLTARVIFSGLEFAGYLVGQVAGLTNVLSPGLGSFQGSTAVANLLLIAAIVLIFVTNTDALILRALMFSYQVFPFGHVILPDMASQIVKAISASFYIGLMTAAPFLVMGLVVNLGLGLANRMMPALPVFFVAGSVLIAAAFLVLSVTAPEMLRVFIDRFSQWLGSFTL